MTTNAYVNLDARELAKLAEKFASGEATFNYYADGRDLANACNQMAARLQAIAARLQHMDDKIARHIEGGDFEAGAALARMRQAQRSNVLKAPRVVSNEDGETLIAALEAQGKSIKKLPLGARTAPKAETIEVDTSKSLPARRGFKLSDL